MSGTSYEVAVIATRTYDVLSPSSRTWIRIGGSGMEASPAPEAAHQLSARSPIVRTDPPANSVLSRAVRCELSAESACPLGSRSCVADAYDTRGDSTTNLVSDPLPRAVKNTPIPRPTRIRPAAGTCRPSRRSLQLAKARDPAYPPELS